MLVLDCFLLIRGVKFLGASLLLTFRISNFLLANSHLTDHGQQPTNPHPTLNDRKQPTLPLGDPNFYIPSEKSPDVPDVTESRPC